MVRREWVDGTFCYETDSSRVNYVVEGSCSGIMYTEEQTYTDPENVDVDIDVKSLEIEVNIFTDEGDQERSLGGDKAWDFLNDIGFDEFTIEWELSDEY